MSNVTKLLSNFGSRASHFVIYAVMYSLTGQQSPLTEGKKMTTQALIGNMIDKYVEVYARAIAAGCDDMEAHAVTAKFFADGFGA